MSKDITIEEANSRIAALEAEKAALEKAQKESTDLLVEANNKIQSQATAKPGATIVTVDKKEYSVVCGKSIAIGGKSIARKDFIESEDLQKEILKVKGQEILVPVK